MGRLVKITPAAQEQQEEKRTVVGTGAHGRLVKTGDVQRTSPTCQKNKRKSSCCFGERFNSNKISASFRFLITSSSTRR